MKIKKPVANDTRQILKDGTFRWDNHVYRARDWPRILATNRAQGISIKRIEPRIEKGVMCVFYQGLCLARTDLVGETFEHWESNRRAKVAESAGEMLELLRPYLQHKHECWMAGNNKKCTCGLAQILPEMEYGQEISKGGDK